MTDSGEIHGLPRPLIIDDECSPRQRIVDLDLFDASPIVDMMPATNSPAPFPMEIGPWMAPPTMVHLPIPSLINIQYANVQEVFNLPGRPDQLVCEVGNTDVRLGDFLRLRPGGWLNDQVINGLGLGLGTRVPIYIYACLVIRSSMAGYTSSMTHDKEKEGCNTTA